MTLTRPARGDLVAAVTVALVLVPQSIAYATLAGLPPQHGLYAAAAAPVFAGLAGSSPYLQTGPVALTSLLTLGALAPVAEAGTESFAAHAALLALIVGVVRVAVGVTRLGYVSYLMSQPVVSAFTLGAAILIACSQLPAVLGVRATSHNPVIAVGQAVLRPGEWHWLAIVVGVVCLLITLFAWRLHPLVPGAMIATLGALLVERLVNIDVATVGPIPDGLPHPSLDLPWAALPSLLVAGVVIALIGFAEPASIARQYASADRSRWSPDQEFVGQGLANLGAGIFGGYPAGGSFSRSALNRMSGASTRWSGVFTGLLVLLVLPVAGVLSDLPQAALAGLVIASVIPLLNPRPVLRTYRMSRPQFLVALVTLGVSLAAAPQVQWGVIAGVVLALATHLWRELRLDIDTWIEDQGTPGADDVLHVRPQGVLYFGSAPLLETLILEELAAHPNIASVEVHLQRLGRVDLTGALVLRAICRDLDRADVPVLLSGAQPHCRRLIESVFAGDPVSYTRQARATGDRAGSDTADPPPGPGSLDSTRPRGGGDRDDPTTTRPT